MESMKTVSGDRVSKFQCLRLRNSFSWRGAEVGIVNKRGLYRRHLNKSWFLQTYSQQVAGPVTREVTHRLRQYSVYMSVMWCFILIFKEKQQLNTAQLSGQYQSKKEICMLNVLLWILFCSFSEAWLRSQLFVYNLLTVIRRLLRSVPWCISMREFMWFTIYASKMVLFV